MKVTYIQHMGSDKSIVNTARISVDGKGPEVHGELSAKDKALLQRMGSGGRNVVVVRAEEQSG